MSAIARVTKGTWRGTALLALLAAACSDGTQASGGGGAGGTATGAAGTGVAGASVGGAAGNDTTGIAGSTAGAAGSTGSGGSAGASGSTGVGGNAGAAGSTGVAGGGGSAGAAGSTSVAGSGGAAGGGHAGGPSGGGAGGRRTSPPSHDVDILFMVDNSSSMSKTQARLAAAFPKFMQVLGGLPGGMPNLHIAIVSSDMGAGAVTNGCDGNGQAGIFQADPVMLDSLGNPCATTLAPGARFISNVNGVANYTAPIGQVFSCIAALGDAGCGFEQPLLSVAHALGADNYDATGRPQPPLENQGFLRDDAYLVIVLITNEDDCSALGGASSELFPRASGEDLSSRLGPPTGYRCNAFGHLCGTPPAPPPIVSPMGENDPGDLTTVVTLDDCIPSDGGGKLIPVPTIETGIKALKADPANQILITSIAGLYPDNSAGAPYAVAWKKSVSGDPAGPWPEMVHSCVSATDGSFADPAVRIGALVDRFGANGFQRSICEANMEAALEPVVTRLGALMAAP
jgi:hypothetical protein